MSFFKDKIIVITGGSDGIGRALIDVLVPLGAKIATCARNYDKLYNLQLQYPHVLLHTMACDVSNETECKRFMDSVLEEFGRIDILINNAGISMRSLFNDVDVDVMKKVMDVNFFGAVYCTKYALPSIMENKGTVVGISSTAGYRGLPGRSGYSASKFALQGWLEALRSEMTGSGVNVMWVSPGFTASNIRNAALNEKGEAQGESPLDESKLMSAEACAIHIIKAIEKRKRTLILTSTGKLAVFMNKFFPAWSDKLLYNHFFKDKKLVK
ncbi:MAG TPA: SDR family oxidoreductase [Puia sp.]|nr:SDR family oxidoreductase [Puia sp.]